MTRMGMLLGGVAMVTATQAPAAELEVTHWWTSGGEAAAVSEFAKAFEERTDHTWVDGAIAGSGSTARPIMISRITGGDPMAATQFNHGRQAEELVEAGLMRPLTEIAESENWRDVIVSEALLDSCTLDGEVYCVPVNMHSWPWLWLSNAAFEEAGVPVPTNWQEFVDAAPALREAGKVPLAVGNQPWQALGAFDVLLLSLGGKDLYLQIYDAKDAEAAAGAEMAEIFQAADQARQMAQGGNVQGWNEATNLVITDQAGGQIMGDWAQGEFQVAGEVAGEDYTCLPGLGVSPVLTTAGDAFYFPVLRDEEKSAAQAELASVMFSPEVQVAFNLKKGSLPIRTDVDLTAANDCMQKGLEIVEADGLVPSTDQLISPDTSTELQSLMTEFFNDMSITPEDAQARYADILSRAD